MEFLKKTSAPVNPKKRPLDEAISSEGEGFRKRGTMVSKYPDPKIISEMQVVRDFPSGCGITNDKLVEYDTVVHNNESIIPKELGKNKLSFGTRPTGKVKFLDPTCSKGGVSQKPKVTTTIVTLRKPLTNLENVDSTLSRKVASKKSYNIDSNLGKTTSHGKENNINGIEPCFGSRSTRKVTFWDPTSLKEDSELTMEFLKKTSDAAKPRKRKLDEAIDFEVEGFRKGGSTVSKYPPPEIRSGVQGVRFAPSHEITDDKMLEYQAITTNLKSIKPTELGNSKASFGSRPSGKVKFWDPTCSNGGVAQNPKVTTTIVTLGKPLKNLENVDSTLRRKDSLKKLYNGDSNLGRTTSHGKENNVNRSERCYGSSQAGKVTFWDPSCLKEDFLKKTSEPVKPRKPIDEAIDIEVEGFRKRGTTVSKYPPPEIRSGVQVVRGFRPACGITDDKMVEYQAISNNLESIKPAELGKNKASFGSRPAGKVKFWDPTCSKGGVAKKPKVTTSIVTRRKPLENLENSDSTLGRRDVFKKTNNIHSNLGKTNSHAKENSLNRIEPCFGSRLDGKITFWDPTCSKEGNAQISLATNNVTVTKQSQDSITERKPLESLNYVTNNLGKTTSYGHNKGVESQPPNNNKLEIIKPGDLRRNNPSFGSRLESKVKFWDPNCSKVGNAENYENNTIIISQKEHSRHGKIKEALTLFDVVYEQLFQENKLKTKGEKIAHWRVPQEASKIVKQKLKLMNAEKVLGPICGVQVGDTFKFRSQLQMVGLHCQPQSGIDFTKVAGKNLALSIVDSHRYSNESTSCDALIYSGQGGLGFLGCKLPPEDQKLERGNLALKNSMDEKTHVRVIRKVDGVGKNKQIFVYDGLYIVSQCKQNKGPEGKIIFKFLLNRVPGQPPLHKMLNAIN